MPLEELRISVTVTITVGQTAFTAQRHLTKPEVAARAQVLADGVNLAQGAIEEAYVGVLAARSRTPLEILVDQVLKKNMLAVAEYFGGNRPEALGFLMGQVQQVAPSLTSLALIEATLRERLKYGGPKVG